MSRWISGFVDVCREDERRTAECRVDECLGTLNTGHHSFQCSIHRIDIIYCGTFRHLVTGSTLPSKSATRHTAQ